MKNKLLLLAMGFALTTQMTMAQVPSYVPTNGLVGYWPFNGNANDESGNGNNGAVIGATLTSDRNGNTNKAFGFNAIGDIINLPEIDSSIGTPNNSSSYSIWFKGEPINGNNNVGILLRATNNTFDYQLRFEVTRAVGGLTGLRTKVYYRCPAENNEPVNSSLYDPNIWHNIIVVINGSTGDYSYYFDGVYESSMSFTFNSSNNYYTSSRSWQIGSLVPNPFTPSHQFFGSIDDICIWNRALTQQEITNLYNSTSTSECLTMTINTGVLSTSPVAYTSTVNIYPNPANDQITIDCGNLANVVGWSIKIANMLGQEVFNQPMNTQQYVVPLNSWTGQGMYFVKIINAQNEVVNIKKIILQ